LGGWGRGWGWGVGVGGEGSVFDFVHWMVTHDPTEIMG
jgi:hypothetical protein